MSGVGDGVGPVLHATPLARALVAAILEENDDVIVHDEGAYLRIASPRVCRLSHATIERVTGERIELPGDLELLMSSFAGLMKVSESGALWWLASEPAPTMPLDLDRPRS
jgi:toluene monooxygenase system protein D